jgi:formate dehydrogenase subunit gamma
VSTTQVIPSRRTDGDERPILRYTFIERVNHWFGSLVYVYCLITGLAFWSPYMYWLAAIVGGGPSARFWHPWFGLAFTLSMFLMFWHWDRDMRITEADRRWSRAMKYYTENEDEKVPPAGRFNYGQKLFFWLMFYGVILLLISGIGLWFIEGIPWSLRWLRYLAVTVHVAIALATIGGFIIHVYMSTAFVRGSFTAMMQGKVSRLWARTHHRLWYERVTGDRSDAERR